jgi:hypothetical protein
MLIEKPELASATGSHFYLAKISLCDYAQMGQMTLFLSIAKAVLYPLKAILLRISNNKRGDF